MDVGMNELQQFFAASQERREGSSVQLARKTGFADWIRFLLRVKPQASDDLVLGDVANALEIEVREATMSEGLIQRESRNSGHLGRLHSREDRSSKVGSVGGVDRGAEKRVSVSFKVHAIRIDVNIETPKASEIQDRDEIGTELRDMQHSTELDLAHRLPPNLWSKHNRPHTL